LQVIATPRRTTLKGDTYAVKNGPAVVVKDPKIVLKRGMAFGVNFREILQDLDEQTKLGFQA
jgi:hypothetical protein